MRTVYKYPIPACDFYDVYAPANAQVLSVAEQQERIVVYMLVDPDAGDATKPVRIVITGTGRVAPGPEFTFLGTVKLCDGALMFHVFFNKE